MTHAVSLFVTNAVCTITANAVCIITANAACTITANGFCLEKTLSNDAKAKYLTHVFLSRLELN